MGRLCVSRTSRTRRGLSLAVFERQWLSATARVLALAVGAEPSVPCWVVLAPAHVALDHAIFLSVSIGLWRRQRVGSVPGKYGESVFDRIFRPNPGRLGPCPKLKVFYSVVVSHTVYMVHVLPRHQPSAYCIFHDQDVLHDIASARRAFHDVTGLVARLSAFVCCALFTSGWLVATPASLRCFRHRRAAGTELFVPTSGAQPSAMLLGEAGAARLTAFTGHALSSRGSRAQRRRCKGPRYAAPTRSSGGLRSAARQAGSPGTTMRAIRADSV
jgi:hypothetical protein